MDAEGHTGSRPALATSSALACREVVTLPAQNGTATRDALFEQQGPSAAPSLLAGGGSSRPRGPYEGARSQVVAVPGGTPDTGAARERRRPHDFGGMETVVAAGIARFVRGGPHEATSTGTGPRLVRSGGSENARLCALSNIPGGISG